MKSISYSDQGNRFIKWRNPDDQILFSFEKGALPGLAGDAIYAGYDGGQDCVQDYDNDRYADLKWTSVEEFLAGEKGLRPAQELVEITK